MNRKKLFSGCLLALALCGMALCWLIPMHLWMVIAGVGIGAVLLYSTVLDSSYKQWRQIRSRCGRLFIIGEAIVFVTIIIVSIWLFWFVKFEPQFMPVWVWMATVALRMLEVLLFDRDE